MFTKDLYLLIVIADIHFMSLLYCQGRLRVVTFPSFFAIVVTIAVQPSFLRLQTTYDSRAGFKDGDAANKSNTQNNRR